MTKSQIFFSNFVRLIFLKKMIYYTLTLTNIFKVKSSIFLSIFKHEYLANDLTLEPNFVWFLPGSRTIGQKKITYILKSSPQCRKFKMFWGRDYLEIGKSFSCEIWSAGSHKTSNECLRKKFERLQKLGDQGDFLKF